MKYKNFYHFLIYNKPKAMKRRDFIRNTASALAGLSLVGITTAFKEQEIPYRILGKTGLKVSLIGIGGYHIGDRFTSDELSVNIIRSAIDMGINFMDNAWCYNDGRSEELMGKALLDGYRDKVVLMTKHHGRDPETAKKHLEESLKRFHTDHIDIWQFHEIKTLDEVDMIYSSGVLDFALKAKEAGKVRHIGFTGHSNPKVHHAMIDKGFEWETVQMPLNVLDHHYLSFAKEIIPLLQKNNIGIIGMKSVASGSIVRENIASIEECLNFTMTLPISTLVSGINKHDHLKQNVEIAKNHVPMSQEEIEKLLDKTYDAAQGGKYEWYKDK